jgi:hypothetical protein
MRLIQVLEQWALERKSRWLAKIDFQDNSNTWISRADLIWVGCIGIAVVSSANDIQFHMKLNRMPMNGLKNVSDPEFFGWLDQKFVEAGIFKT